MEKPKKLKEFEELGNKDSGITSDEWEEIQEYYKYKDNQLKQ